MSGGGGHVPPPYSYACDDGRSFRSPRSNCERIAAFLGWKETGRSKSFRHPSQSQGSVVVDYTGGTLLSSSMLATSMSDGNSSSAMLLTRQGPGSDAMINMAVPRSDWNQNTKRIKEGNDHHATQTSIPNNSPLA